MKFADFPHGLIMEFPCVRSLVEVKITSEYLVSTFTTQYHLDTHATDDTGQQVHRSRCTDGRDIIRLSIVNHIADSIETFLDGVVHLVVHSTDIVGNFLRFRQVGCTFQSNSKAMEARPPGIVLIVGLNTLGCVELGNGRYD